MAVTDKFRGDGVAAERLPVLRLHPRDERFAVVVAGRASRVGHVPFQIAIPQELHRRLRYESLGSINQVMVALMRQALNWLDADGLTLHAEANRGPQPRSLESARCIPDEWADSAKREFERGLDDLWPNARLSTRMRVDGRVVVQVARQPRVDAQLAQIALPAGLQQRLLRDGIGAASQLVVSLARYALRRLDEENRTLEVMSRNGKAKELAATKSVRAPSLRSRPDKAAKSRPDVGSSLSEDGATVPRRIARRDERIDFNSLSALGISESEELAYRIILTHHKPTAKKVAALLSLPLEEATLLLENLEDKGLAIHTPEQPRRYIATPPEFAAEFITKQRHADLELARLNMRNMRRLGSNVQEPLEQSAEIITDQTMLNQLYCHLSQTAREEVLVFQRAPVLFDSSKEGRRDDLKIRVVVDATHLDRHGAELSRKGAEAGEEVRFFRSLPAKIIIVDREVAVIHLSTNGALEETRLIVRRPSGLLDALLVLFELVWERASPMAPDGKPGADEAMSEASHVNGQLITLLSLGLNDKAIAHEAGISSSTITRRVAELMQSYGTRTRFQLGWRAALDAFPERLAALRGSADGD